MIQTRNLYFINTSGERRLLASDIEKDSVSPIIKSFLDERGYKSYYTRIWETKEGTMYDVGSYTEFFLWGNECDNCS